MDKEKELLLIRKTIRECLVLSREQILAKLETADAEYIDEVKKNQELAKHIALASKALDAIKESKSVTAKEVEVVTEMLAPVGIFDPTDDAVPAKEDPFVDNAAAADDSLDDLP